MVSQYQNVHCPNKYKPKEEKTPSAPADELAERDDAKFLTIIMLFYFNFRKCDKLSTFNTYAIWYQHTKCHLVKEYGVMNDRIIIKQNYWDKN